MSIHWIIQRLAMSRQEKNMNAADIPIKVYERDLFSENLNKDMQLFDIVYSLGFVETSEELNIVVKKHAELLKPGGILVLGIPNLEGYIVFSSKKMHLNI
jgi:2-polyprenyl-3-methyl-5-hydroxy-6-metoxy-1,4-benzoquinol methylase